MVATFLVCFALALILFLLSYISLKNGRVKWCYLAWFFKSLCLFPLAVSAYIAYYTLFANVKDEQRFLNPGISYTREMLNLNAGKAVIHSIELPVSTIDITVTPPVNVGSELKNKAMTTSDALLTYGADIAINASFFSPFKDNHFLDFYPHKGDFVTPIGATIASEDLNGKPANWPVFIVYKNNQLAIKNGLNNESTRSIKAMVSGRSKLIENGKLTAALHTSTYPRAAIGLSKDTTTLWLFAVDGKQAFYSDGMSLKALSEYMLSKGVYNALELDGGGSVTMAWLNHQQAEVLNRPIHTKIPNRERPVANHLLITVNH